MGRAASADAYAAVPRTAAGGRRRQSQRGRGSLILLEARWPHWAPGQGIRTWIRGSKAEHGKSARGTAWSCGATTTVSTTAGDSSS